MPIGIYDRTKCKPRPPHSEETKIKIGLANKGKKRTPEQIQNIINSLPKNKKLSKETKRKIGLASKGKRSHNWKGGRTIANGYVRLYKPNHPSKNSRGYITEHRYIIEKELRCILNKDVRVHHINGNKLDNRLDNLMAFKNIRYHRAFHNFIDCLNNNGIIYYSGYPLTYLVKNTTKIP